jgi:hypothetical protein
MASSPPIVTHLTMAKPNLATLHIRRSSYIERWTRDRPIQA